MPNEAFIGAPAVNNNPVGAHRNSSGVMGSVRGAVAAGAARYATDADFRQDVNSQVSKAYNSAKEIVGGKGPKSSKPSGGSGGGRRSSRGGSGGGGLSLTTGNPNPSLINLNTGIEAKGYVEYFMTPEELKCSPLHVNCAFLYIPTTATDAMYEFLSTVAIPKLQEKAQLTAPFNMNTSTDFSVANVRNYLIHATKAFQVYFSYRSIISYNSNPLNRNKAMLDLRYSITADMQEKLNLLGHTLSSIPYPPKLLEMVRYLAGNFSSGPSANTPLLKFWPDYQSSTLLNLATIQSAIDGLNNTSDNRTASLLYKAMPNWIHKDLQDVPVNPVYDPNFIAIFNNFPFVWSDGTTVTHTPTVTSVDDTITYNSPTNDLDGAAMALTSVYTTVNGVNQWQSGILKPMSNETPTDASTRLSYYDINGVTQFYASLKYQFLRNARQDTYTLDETDAVTSLHLYGNTLVQGVNGRLIFNTSESLMMYLMSLPDIPMRRGK